LDTALFLTLICLRRVTDKPENTEAESLLPVNSQESDGGSHRVFNTCLDPGI